MKPQILKQTSYGQIVQFRHNGKHPSPLNQEVVQVSDGDAWLNSDALVGFVDAQYIRHVVEVDLVALLFVMEGLHGY